jgi:hypothetical protein
MYFDHRIEKTERIKSMVATNENMEMQESDNIKERSRRYQLIIVDK